MAILQNTTVSGSLVVTGDLTARQFILSSSVTFFTESFASGSTRFGDSLDDTMVVTGSLRLTGSLAATGSATFKLASDRNFAIKYDTNITLSAQSDSAAPESLRVYADTFRLFTATTAVGLTERLTISNTGAATFSSNVTANNYFRASQSTIGGFFQGWDGTNEVDFGSWKSIIGSGNSYDAIILSSHASSGFFVMTGGSSTPKLTIASTGAATFSSSVTATTATLSTTYNGGSVGQLHMTSNGTEGGAITFEKTSGTAQKYKLGCSSTNTLFVYNETAGNQPFTLSSTGQISQTTSIADWSHVISNTSSTSPNGIIIQYTNANKNNTGNLFLYCTDNFGATLKHALYSNGGIANFQTNDVNLSDERTKKDITPLESYWDKFKDIEIVKFKYKDQTHDDFNIGVIAQQVEEIAPEFVETEGWGKEDTQNEEPLKSIYTADLYHATIKVLQEAMAKIEVLEAKVTALENK